MKKCVDGERKIIILRSSSSEYLAVFPSIPVRKKKKKDGFEGERDIPENNCKEHKTAIILLSVSFMYITRLEDQWSPSVDFYFLFIKNISGSRKIKPWEEVA